MCANRLLPDYVFEIDFIYIVVGKEQNVQISRKLLKKIEQGYRVRAISL